MIKEDSSEEEIVKKKVKVTNVRSSRTNNPISDSSEEEIVTKKVKVTNVR